MKLIPKDDIIIGEDRIRRYFDKERLDQLASSIESTGLLHLPVVRHNEKLEVVLIAGERRVSAMKLLHARGKSFIAVSPNGHVTVPPGMIPVNFVSELEPDKILEAELEENIARQDISWHERVQAEARLHELRRRQNPAHTIRDTAQEILGDNFRKESTHQIKKHLLLNQHMDDPDISKAASLEEAERRLMKKRDRLLMESFGDFLMDHFDPTENLFYENKDCFVGMQELLDAGTKIDIICTDPPYGIDAQGFRNFNSLATHEYNDAAEDFEKLITRFARSAHVVCNEEAHLFLFCEYNRFLWLREMLESEGWQVWRRPMIWAKTSHMGAPEPDIGPARQYECILFARLGERKQRKLLGDVLIHPVVKDKLHSAQKPVALIKDLLERVATPGDTVLDPFAGVGPTIIAARQLQLRCHAYEINEDTYKRGIVHVNVEDE